MWFRERSGSRFDKLSENKFLSPKLSDIFRAFRDSIGLILMFHRVMPGKEKSVFNSILEVTPEYLEYCINYFKKRDYAFISLDAIHHILNNRDCLSKKFVAFTFDDGYADIFHYAYPLLKKYNIPFAVYIPTSFPDGKAIPWWYLIEEVILVHDQLTFETADKVFHLKCQSIVEKRRALNQLEDIFIDNRATDHLLGQFLNQNKDAFYKTLGKLLLTWEQIKYLSRDRNITIASHASSHRALNKLSTAEVRAEILESRGILETQIGREVTHFAYPFGGRDTAARREFDIIKELNFKTATTTRCGHIFYEHGKHMECLPRVMAIEGRNMFFRASGALPFLKNRFRSFVTE
jgi:peptidoglycan/xylan/chitin deacetylase (PgdA/CDA1 family)